MINCAIIGLGNIGFKKYELISNNKIFKISSVCDINKKTLSKISDAKISKYLNFKNISLENLELVIITTNPIFSFDIAKYFLLNKKHVLIEKPPTNKYSKFKFLSTLARKNNLLFKISFNFLFDKTFIRCKKILESNKLGRIFNINFQYLYGTVGVNKNEVGAFMDICIHLIAFCIFFFGENIKVLSHINKSYEQKKNLNDYGIVLLSYQNSMIIIEYSHISWKNKFSLIINGSKGTLNINGLSKWDNQKFYFEKRVLPAGRPIKKNIDTINIDNSFLNELLHIKKKILSTKKIFNYFKKESYNFDASVMSLCKKIDSKNNSKDIYFK